MCVCLCVWRAQAIATSAETFTLVDVTRAGTQLLALDSKSSFTLNGDNAASNFLFQTKATSASSISFDTTGGMSTSTTTSISVNAGTTYGLTAGGNMNVESSNGNLVVDVLGSAGGNGDATLSAEGNIAISSVGTLGVTSTGNMEFVSNSGSSDLTLTAAGTGTNGLKMTSAGVLSATSTGAMTLTSTGGNVVIHGSGSSSNVRVTASATADGEGFVVSSASDVLVTAASDIRLSATALYGLTSATHTTEASGAMLLSTPATSSTMTLFSKGTGASALSLRSDGGLGITSTGAFTVSGSSATMQVANTFTAKSGTDMLLETTGAVGEIFVHSAGTAANAIDIEATGGITVLTGSGIGVDTQSLSMTSAGNVDVLSGGTITLSANALSLEVNGGSGTIDVVGSGAFTTTGTLLLSSSTTATLFGDNAAVVTSPGEVMLSANGASPLSVISDTGNLLLSSASTLGIRSDSHTTIAADNILATASGTFSVTGQTGVESDSVKYHELLVIVESRHWWFGSDCGQQWRSSNGCDRSHGIKRELHFHDGHDECGYPECGSTVDVEFEYAVEEWGYDWSVCCGSLHGYSVQYR